MVLSRFTILLVILLFAHITTKPYSRAFIRPPARVKIYGGEKASKGEFPFAVALVEASFPQSPICAGSLIHPEWVLTAAHCFSGGIQLKHYKFAIGRVDLRKSDGVLVSGKEHYLHPGYNERDPYIMNDIALVKLAQPVPLSDDIQVIGIASVEIPVGTWGWEVGWGGVNPEIDHSKEMMKVSLPIRDRKHCALTSKEAQSKICVGTIGKDSCAGDSGGPLAFKVSSGNETKWIVAGVLSYGPDVPCGGLVDSESVFTKVSYFANWIRLYVPVNFTVPENSFGGGNGGTGTASSMSVSFLILVFVLVLLM